MSYGIRLWTFALQQNFLAKISFRAFFYFYYDSCRHTSASATEVNFGRQPVIVLERQLRGSFLHLASHTMRVIR